MTPTKTSQLPPTRRTRSPRPQLAVAVRSFPPDLPGTAWLRVEDVLQYVPVSRAVWFRRVKSGEFPKPHKVGRLAFWRARDIRNLLDMGPKRARAGLRHPPKSPPGYVAPVM